MSGEQLNLFNYTNQEKIDSNYEAIRRKLKKYKIDEIYDKKFKNQNSVLWTIKEELEKQDSYNQYYKELIKELSKILPLGERDYNFTENRLFKFKDQEVYGYQSTSCTTSNGIKYAGCSGPIYCLGMLPKNFLGVD